MNVCFIISVLISTVIFYSIILLYEMLLLYFSSVATLLGIHFVLYFVDCLNGGLALLIFSPFYSLVTFSYVAISMSSFVFMLFQHLFTCIKTSFVVVFIAFQKMVNIFYIQILSFSQALHLLSLYTLTVFNYLDVIKQFVGWSEHKMDYVNHTVFL